MKGEYAMANLVERLSGGPHPIIMGGPSQSAQELRNRLTEVGYVFIKFTETNGGTDLGVRVDPIATCLDKADFVTGSGNVHIEGTLNLDFTPVRCIAELDVASLSGQGYLLEKTLL